MSVPAARWNIHPGSGTWLVCYVWKEKHKMHDFVAGRQPDWERTYAACYLGNVYASKTNGDLITRKLGELHFAQIGAGIVAHEIQHFISDWILSMGWGLEKHNEEISLMSGKLTTEFWNCYYDHFELEPG